MTVTKEDLQRFSGKTTKQNIRKAPKKVKSKSKNNRK